MHSDNGIFVSDKFRLDCDKKHQEKYLSGVGAHNKNARSEREIKTIMYVAGTFMVHSSLHWKDRGANDISICFVATKHAVWLHNCLPNYHSGITPLELLTRNKANHRDLRRSRVWRFPVFGLVPKLKNYQTIPKLNRRYFLGQLLGFS